MSAIYVVKPENIAELHAELGSVTAVHGNLVFANEFKPACFALDIWQDPVVTEIASISDAVQKLKQAGKFWYLNPLENVRRSRLIEEQLRKLPELKRHFPVHDAISDIGCYSLIDKNTLVYATKRLKKWPMGYCYFIEDKINPPNRAYLKLWEALTLLGRYPQPGETAMDLGASPGGWTYVMQSLGAKVTAVDKAPLDERIARLPGVSFLQESAFGLDPATWDKQIDWLLCDVACYPDRLYDLVVRWIESGKAKQMIFTIKLQGETNLAIINKFQALPNSRVLNLFYNKHEATFFYPWRDDLPVTNVV